MHIPKPGVANICFLIAIGALLVVQMPGFANDPGLGWHLADGEWILSHRAIPSYDPFLHSTAPRPWVSDQWLSDVVFFAVLSLKGWPLLYAFVTVVYITTFFLLLYTAIRRSTRLFLGAALGTLFAFKIAQVHFIVRPVALSFLFFTIAYLLLWQASRRLNAHRLFLFLPAVMLLWANFHPSFVVGLLLIAVWSLARCLSARGMPELRASVLTGASVLILSCSASMINPYGYALHESILALGQSKFFMTLHEEWRSPNLTEYDGQLFLLAGLVLWPCVLLSPSFRRRVGLFGILSWMLFFGLSIDAVRMLPYFGIASAIPLAYAGGLISTSRRVRKIARHKWVYRAQMRLLRLPRLERNSLPSFYGVMGLLLLILCGGLVGRLPLYSGDFGPLHERFPYEAVDFLAERAGAGAIPVASHPDWGGFITFWGKGRLKPVIDDRNTLIGESFYRSYFERMTASVESAAVLMRELQVKYLLLPKDSRLAERTRGREEFRQLFKDDKSIVIELLPEP